MLRLLTQQCQWNWHTEVSLITLSQTRWVIDTTESDFLSHWYHWVRLAESLIPPRQTRWVRLAESLISLSQTRWVIDTTESDSLSQTRWVIDTAESDSLSHWYHWVRLAESLIPLSQTRGVIETAEFCVTPPSQSIYCCCFLWAGLFKVYHMNCWDLC